LKGFNEKAQRKKGKTQRKDKESYSAAEQVVNGEVG
jgi:hypothetical protein